MNHVMTHGHEREEEGSLWDMNKQKNQRRRKGHVARRRRVGRWEEISHLDQIDEKRKKREKEERKGKQGKTNRGEPCVRGKGKIEDFPAFRQSKLDGPRIKVSSHNKCYV